MSLCSRLLDLLYPPRCPFCDHLLTRDEPFLCARCQKELPWTMGEQGRRKGEFFSVCAAPLWYQGLVRESHHRYKFSGTRCYAKPYAKLMAQCVQDRLDGPFDTLTWVPLSKRRLRRRGYDQARLLAEELAAHLGMCAEPLLVKARDTKAQSTLSGASERRANVLGVYSLRPDVNVDEKRVLLVDDVTTTGATLAECARVLRTAGAAEVVCVTLAMAGAGEQGAP